MSSTGWITLAALSIALLMLIAWMLIHGAAKSNRESDYQSIREHERLKRALERDRRDSR